ncbi:MAG: hypothetical protein LBR40_03475, partial [Bacilli bacterium]|nr:hypothetical protein [Bacilli bacterium]
MTIKNKSLLTFIIVMVMMVGLFLINTLKIEATVNYGLEQSQVLDDPNVVIRGTDTGGNNDTANAEALLEAATTSSSASWKNATNYYIVYPDAASAGSLQDGDTTSVTYEGVTVDAIVIIGNDFKAGSLVSAAKADTTIFLKSGNYVNLSKNAKGAFQLNFSNLSVIGVDGPGTVTIHSEKSGTLNWSIGIGGTNVLLQNLIFDGDNAGMANQSNSSGYYFLKILQNATNITFDNVTVQNIPSSGSGFYNVAINVIYAKNVLFNNVSLINLASKTGYSVIQVNNSSRAVYFNNLSLDNVKSGNSASGGSNYPFIKIEDGSTVTSELNQVSVYFTGDLTFANMDDQYKKIWIQNYKYDTVAFPSDVYRYAQLRNQNGSWT